MAVSMHLSHVALPFPHLVRARFLRSFPAALPPPTATTPQSRASSWFLHDEWTRKHDDFVMLVNSSGHKGTQMGKEVMQDVLVIPGEKEKTSQTMVVAS